MPNGSSESSNLLTTNEWESLSRTATKKLVNPAICSSVEECFVVVAMRTAN